MMRIEMRNRILPHLLLFLLTILWLLTQLVPINIHQLTNRNVYQQKHSSVSCAVPVDTSEEIVQQRIASVTNVARRDILPECAAHCNERFINLQLHH